MKGLLSVSFGTSHEQARAKAIDAIDADLREEFPDFAFYSAWTSNRIIQKLKDERGEQHDTLEEALARMTADGIGDLIVSTSCLIRGAEMGKVVSTVRKWVAGGKRVAQIAEPLLATEKDCHKVADILRDEFSFIPPRDSLLLMGHGSCLGDNSSYTMMQSALREMNRDWFFVATLEGSPGLEEVLPNIEAYRAQRVYLAPLMTVAGVHALDDLAGNDAGSWANRLRERGFDVEVVLKGLGEIPAIRRFMIAHVHEALAVREVGLRG